MSGTRYKRVYSSESKSSMKSPEKEKADVREIRLKFSQEKYDSLIKTGEQNVTTSLEYDSMASTSEVGTILPRPIIIDGANILYSGSCVQDPIVGKPFPDVLALLSVVRYFVSQGFEVMVVTIAKFHETARKTYKGYSNFAAALDDDNRLKTDDKVPFHGVFLNHSELFNESMKKKLKKYCENAGNELVASLTNDEKLHDYGVVYITPRGTDDDKLVIRLANTVHGLMVSNDKYVNHTESENIVMGNRVGIRFEEIPETDRNTRTTNGNHFVAGKMFHFQTRKHMVNDDARNIFFVKNNDLRYIFVEDRRKTIYTRERRDEILTMLNELIVEGLQVYQQNTERILKRSRKVFEKDDEEQQSSRNQTTVD